MVTFSVEALMEALMRVHQQQRGGAYSCEWCGMQVIHTSAYLTPHV